MSGSVWRWVARLGRPKDAEKCDTESEHLRVRRGKDRGAYCPECGARLEPHESHCPECHGLLKPW